MNPPFSPAEYDRRLTLAHAAMEAAGLDAIICVDPSNQNWLTGYDGWSFYVHQAVILIGGERPIWWGRRMDANGAARTVDTERTEVTFYTDDYIQSTERHPMQALATLLVERGMGAARIGVEFENYYYSAAAHGALERALPDAELVDSTALINWQRGVKSPEEIAFMRKAAAITDKIQTLAIDMAEPGVRKNELAGKITAAGLEGIGEDWGDYPAIVPLMPSGADASAPHLTWNGDLLRSGEATFFELSGCYRRYHAPLSRTVYLGAPPDSIVRAADALVAGLDAGLEVARAGNRACDIANALGDALAAAGVARSGRCGYPVGASYPPDWGERTVSLRAEDETILKPGMTFHFMPGLWQDDWGLEITESILIREEGPAETLCNIERKLFVKP